MNRGNSKWIVVALAFAVPLAFAAYTSHIWEDYFITLRFSRNLVEGHGLVFTPGERVHGFTSPLGVLLPALFTWMTGPGAEETAIWIFRLLNAGLLAAAAAMIWRRTETLGMGAVCRTLLFALWLTEAKLTDFSINGMETAILVFFVILLWSELEAPSGPRPAWVAAACAGLMWTRPDACILGAALIVPHVVPWMRGDRPGAIAWAPLLKGIAIGGLIYLPWFAWAWWYYGSPVPHTITAKSVYVESHTLLGFVFTPLRTLAGASPFDGLFLPSYWATFRGDWPRDLMGYAHLLAVGVGFAWAFRVLSPAARRASLALFIGSFYLGTINLFPWYLPPWTVLAIVALALAADDLCRWAAKEGRRRARAAILTGCGIVVAVQAALWCCVAWQARVQQDLIENSGRKVVGEWLRVHAQPGDRVFLESLGYIGYYSRLKMYDYPGLCSPEVVAAIRAGESRFPQIVARLQPEWLALRPREMDREGFVEQELLSRYRLAKVVTNKEQIDALSFLPGRRWLEFDSQFVVFERLDHAGR